jgi:hypothetical protein
MTGPGSHNYTDLPPTNPTPSGAYVVNNNPPPGPSYNDPANKKKMDLGRLSNLVLLVGVIALVGSLAFAITQTQQITGNRAATYTLEPSKLANITESTAFMTRTVTQFPKSYNSKPIPQTILNDANVTYFTVDTAKRNRYIINRVVLYYIMRDALKESDISFTDPGESPTFTQIEEALPTMKQTLDSNLLSTADFAFVKAYFTTFNNEDIARAKFGQNLEPKARELVEKYRQQFVNNPSNLEQVVSTANSDLELQLLTNAEKAMYFKGYFADLNNVPEQDNYIYDEEFDDILFTLPVNQASQIFSLNGISPYMYIVVYPTKIDIKKYKSLKDIVAQKFPLLGY